MKEYQVVIALGDIHTSVLASCASEAEDIAMQNFKRGQYEPEVNFIEAEIKE